MKKTIYSPFYGKRTLSTLVIIALIATLAANSLASYQPGPLGEIDGVEPVIVNLSFSFSFGVQEMDEAYIYSYVPMPQIL